MCIQRWLNTALGWLMPQRFQLFGRTKQLQYTWLRTLMGRYVEFWQVTGDALDFALETHQVSDSSLREDLMQAYLELSCYPEVPLGAQGVVPARNPVCHSLQWLARDASSGC